MISTAPKQCPPACDDGNPCTTDTCDANGRCHHENLPDGTVCDDGNACTRTDACQAGTCVGSNSVVCTASDQCHVAGTCDPASGICSNPNAPDDTACDDGNACTQSDGCVAGACVGYDPVVCTASDQCHAVGTCDPANGICSNPTAPDDTPCDDGNACTQSDGCMAGTCVGYDPVVCTASDQCHVAGMCDPGTGACSNPPVPDGTTCNDGNACTQTDACIAGACMGANPVVCTALDQCHVAGTCNPGTGACSNPNVTDGTTCNDGDACTRSDACVAGACVGSNPVVCTASDQCHVSGACNPATGACSTPAASDGTSCDDGNPCTTGDACSAGTCVGGAPPDCSDGNACTADTCDPMSGCVSTPIMCTGADSACSGACSDTANGCATFLCDPPALGCTIGYWKNHTTGWTDCTQYTLVGSVLQNMPPSLTKLGSETLLQALEYHGGDAKGILLRQAVAAMLNAYDPTVSTGFPLTAQQVVDDVEAALASNDHSTMLELAQTLDAYNNASGGGCPLN